MKNNQKISALNSWIQHEMTQINITVFDAFTLLYARSAYEAWCGSHFLCYELENDKPKTVGFTGKAEAQWLVRKLGDV